MCRFLLSIVASYFFSEDERFSMFVEKRTKNWKLVIARCNTNVLLIVFIVLVANTKRYKKRNRNHAQRYSNEYARKYAATSRQAHKRKSHGGWTATWLLLASPARSQFAPILRNVPSHITQADWIQKINSKPIHLPNFIFIFNAHSDWIRLDQNIYFDLFREKTNITIWRKLNIEIFPTQIRIVHCKKICSCKTKLRMRSLVTTHVSFNRWRKCVVGQ